MPIITTRPPGQSDVEDLGGGLVVAGALEDDVGAPAVGLVAAPTSASLSERTFDRAVDRAERCGEVELGARRRR